MVDKQRKKAQQGAASPVHTVVCAGNVVAHGP